MVDKVKPLKFESSTSGGTENDVFQTETDPQEDYLAAKGLAFENLDTFLIDKVGRAIVELFPSLYQNVTYTSGLPAAIDFYNSSIFISANRVARYDLIFTGDLLTSETLKIYSADGVAVLRTYTWTHTYSGDLFQSSGVEIT